MTDLPARNHPCHCGSGKKYKVCHLASDEEERRRTGPPLERARRFHELDGRVVSALQTFAMLTIDEEIVSERVAALDELRLGDESDDVWSQLAFPYLLHHARLNDNRTIAERFVAERGATLALDQKEWLASQALSWFGLWDVLEVEPQRGLRVRDRLSGEERFVVEQKGSAVLTPRSGLLARVVDHQGISVLCGLHPRPLSAGGLDAVEREVRRRLRRKLKPIEPERLRSDHGVLDLVAVWEAVCDELSHQPVPKLQNTDGEPLRWCTDVFAFERGREAEVITALGTIEGCQPAEEEGNVKPKSPSLRRFTIFAAGNRLHADWDNTVIASISLDERAARVTLEANSEARADRLRALVEGAGRGALLRHLKRTTKDMQSVLEKELSVAERRPAKPALREVPSDVEVALLRDFKERHYTAWLDSRLPVLDDKTPRQMARTRAGRVRLSALLRDLEFTEGRLPERERFDVGKLRRALKVEE